MAVVLETTASIQQSPTPGGTSYCEFGDSQYQVFSTEPNTKRRTPGTFSALTITVVSNVLTGSTTLQSRKNSINAAQGITISAGASGIFQDLVNTDAIVAGDVFTSKLLVGAGTSFVVASEGINFTASTDTTKRLTHNSAPTPSTTVNYSPVAGGDNAANATEANNQLVVRTIGTLKNLFVYVSSNTNTQAVTVQSRKNTSNGNLTVTVPTITTGIFEDLVNQDTLASGDLIDYAFSAGATNTGSGPLNRIACELSTVNSQTVILNAAIAAFAQTTSGTWYYPVGGITRNHSTTESVAQTYATLSTVSNLQLRLSNNTVSAASTFKLRINGTNANQSIIITSNTSGLFEDSVNSDALLGSDLICFQLTTGATGTSLGPTVMAMLMTVLGILPGTLSPRFVFFDTGQYSLGA